MMEKPSADDFFKSIRKCLEIKKINGTDILYFSNRCIIKESGLKSNKTPIYIIREFLEALYRFSKRYGIEWVVFIDRPGNQSSVFYLISSEYEDIGLLIIESRMLNPSNKILVYEVTNNGLDRILQIHGRPNKYPCNSCSFYNNGYCELHKILNPESIRDYCKCYINYKSNSNNPKLDSLREKYTQLCRETYKIGNY